MTQQIAELGEWFLDINEDVSSTHAELKMVEFDDDGVKLSSA